VSYRIPAADADSSLLFLDWKGIVFKWVTFRTALRVAHNHAYFSVLAFTCAHSRARCILGISHSTLPALCSRLRLEAARTYATVLRVQMETRADAAAREWRRGALSRARWPSCAPSYSELFVGSAAIVTWPCAVFGGLAVLCSM